jgi:hypothetical protein
MGHHAALNLSIPPSAVPMLMALYRGALFTLVTASARAEVGRAHFASKPHADRYETLRDRLR